MTDGTIVYVHGTGDRAPQAGAHADLIRARVAEAGRDFGVVASQWGRDAGSDLSAIHRTLPGPHADCGDELAATEVDLEILRHDPFSALAAAGRPSDAEPAPTDAGMLSVALADQLLASAGTGAARAPALATAEVAGSSPTEVSVAVRRAAAQVATSNAYRDARAAAPADLDAAAMRAVAAIAASDLLPASVPDGVWKAVVASIQRWLGSSVVDVLALGAVLAFYVQHDVPPSLGRWATDRLRPRRRCVMEDLVGIADILLYQRDGEAIREVVRRDLTSAGRDGGPVIALGNSLGGVIIVDLLSEADAPRPRLLVTTGSQAPALATFGALGPAATARPFQPWLNVYDPRDLLAFLAEGLWPDEPGIVDHEVDLDIGFPHAHGQTYFLRADVFPAIFDFLDRLPTA